MQKITKMSSSPPLSPLPAHHTNNGTAHHWNKHEIRLELRQAVFQLQSKGLKLAAKFATEQLIGMTNIDATAAAATNTYHHQQSKDQFHTPPHVHEPTNDDFLMTTPRNDSEIIDDSTMPMAATIDSGDDDLVLHAQVLFDLGEFERAASCLSEPNFSVASSSKFTSGRCDGRPLPILSRNGIYLRGYALYLAGERRKEEEMLELRDPLERCSVINSNLKRLAKELACFREKRKLDAFGLYLYGIVLKELHKQFNDHDDAGSCFETDEDALPILIDSILLYPLNWSAWLDLTEMCLANSTIHREVEQRLGPLSNHYMYHFFLVHHFLEQQDHDQALLLIEGLETIFPKSNHLKAQAALAYYSMRDFDQAQEQFVDLRRSDPFRLEHMDIFSNILYVKECKADLSHLAQTLVRTDKFKPETCCTVGNYYALKGQHEKAVQYFERALKLDRSFLSAWTLMGHEYMELKNTPAAIEAYRKAVDINPRDYRAWYGLGQTYEILNMLLFSLFYYRKAATLRPYDARMWCAIGGCYLALNKKSEAIRSYERAMTNNDGEGVATQQLAKLYRDGGESEKAAQCYQKHLDMRGIDTNIDELEAEALLFLGHYHKDAKNYEVASVCCSRLIEYPGPEKEEAKALLREIRSKTDGDRKNRKGGGRDASHVSFNFSP